MVYVQSANYLNGYRNKVGNTKFWRGMRGFYKNHVGEIAGTRSFLNALDAASGFDSQRHAVRFPSLYPS